MSVLDNQIKENKIEEKLNLIKPFLTMLDNDEIDGAYEIDKLIYREYVANKFFLNGFIDTETDPEIEESILSKLNAEQVKELYFSGFFQVIDKQTFVNFLTNDFDHYEVALDLYYTDPKLFNNGDRVHYLLTNINDYLDTCDIDEIDIQEQVLQLYTGLTKTIPEIDIDNYVFELPDLYRSMFITTEEYYDRKRGLSLIIENQEPDTLKEIMQYLSSEEKQHCITCLMELENEYLAYFYINDLSELYNNKDILEQYIKAANEEFIIDNNKPSYPIEVIFNKISEVMSNNGIKTNDLDEEAREILVANSTREKVLNF